MNPLQQLFVLFCLTAQSYILADRPAQSFLREPPDQTAKVGDHVTLPCQVTNKKGTLQWTRDGFGLGVERNLTGFDRYRMSGIDEEGDYTLDIDPVLLEDDATFQCQVGAADGISPIRSRDAILTINVPPQPPIIVNGAFLRTTEDREVEIQCESRGGKPAAEFTWLDGDGTTITEGITTTTEEIENTKRVTAISTLKLTAKKDHHNKNITCQAMNEAETSPASTSIRLSVLYAPHVKIGVDKNPIKENQKVVFTCNADANPNQTTYRWFIDNEIQLGNPTTRFEIENVIRTFNGKIVKCEVNNDIGKSEETEVLDVHYDPKFVIKPKSISGDRGSDVTFVCLVDGNPPPTYTWFRNGDYKHVIGYDANYTVRIDEDSVGRYICRASVKGFPEISATAELFMKGPPRILNTEAIQYGRVGSNVELVCDVFGIPPPPNIFWYNKYGSQVRQDGMSNHFKIIPKRRKDGMKSTLIIRALTETDFGDYNCTSKNEEGIDFYVIKLKEEQSLSLITILSAVIGGVILTVAAILIMILCRRSSALTLKAMNNGDKPTSSSNNTSSSKAMTTTGTSTTSRSYETSEAVKSNGNLFDQDEWETNEELVDSGSLLRKPKQIQPVNYANYQMDMGYPPFGYYQPPPPPLHASLAVDPNISYRGLNVTDPRFAAKYGNPYLRSAGGPPPEIVPQVPLGSPQMPQRGYPAYATLNNRAYSPNLGQQQGQAAVATAKANVNYTGTMVGNGKSSNPPKSSQYIVSPEGDVKADAMATHV